MVTTSSPRSRQLLSGVGATTACILFALLFLVSAPRVDASWYKCVVASDGISKVSPRRGDINCSKLLSIPALSARGGSESASAWNVGSKYNYRGTKSSASTNSRSHPTSRTPYTVADGAGVETKEAIATAFQNREDRNRFIGKTLSIL